MYITRLLILLSLSLPLPSAAQEMQPKRNVEIWNPTACMKAVDPLYATYRSNLQAECFFLPMRVCMASSAPNTCFAELSADVTVFIEETRQKLPKEIAGDGIMPQHYQRALARLDSPYPAPSWCLEAPESSDELCAFLALIEPTMDAFSAARWAEVDLTGGIPRPYFEPNRTDENGGSVHLEPSEINPVNCLSAINAIEGNYPDILHLECADIGANVCSLQADPVTCMESHISHMRDFVLFAKASFPSEPNLSEYNLDYYQFRLENLEIWLDEALECESTSFELVSVCGYAKFVSLTVYTLEIAQLLGPEFLVSLDRP